jgi:hypothetical protein
MFESDHQKGLEVLVNVDFWRRRDSYSRLSTRITSDDWHDGGAGRSDKYFNFTANKLYLLGSFKKSHALFIQWWI